jgi:uncharacterized membrane protein YraQ (UPF0718 family)
VAGVALGEVLRRTAWAKIVSEGNTTSSLLSIGTASLLGIISPLCTYGTVPVVLQFLRKGIPLAPVIAFLSASSLMNPQLFLITWGGVGSELALVRAAVVLLFAFVLGLLLRFVPARLAVHPKVISKQQTQEEEKPKTSPFLTDFWNSLQFVGFYIVVGILIGAAVEVFIPRDWIWRLLNPDELTSVLFASLLGIPLYACGGGTIPLIRSLLESGMGQGAALAFFIVGPATRITPLMALASVLRAPFLLIYVVFLIAYAVVMGMLYQ